MQMTKLHLSSKLLLGFYLLVLISLYLYSFTQVDLSLTLSRVSVWQGIQKGFQWIGYFNRPLSSGMYLSIVLFLFLAYFLLLKQIIIRKIPKNIVWKLILLMTILLTFSYNAFSYDLFNYIFDAKIVTHYAQNPFLHKALDFPGDPMLSFMHWTHRTFPYGLTWLFITVPLSFLGLQYFLATLVLFKLFISACFIGTVYFIGKIMQKLFPENELAAVAFFAFNPLVIIESLVSSHNDIVMMFLSVVSLYFIINKNPLRGIITLILSIGVKFATLLLLPFYGYIVFLQKKKKSVPWEKVFFLMFCIMFIAVLAPTIRTTFQPWYLLYFMPFAALLVKKYYVFIPTVVLSFFGLLQYLPFLYTGNWDPPIPTLLNNMMIAGLLLSVLIMVIYQVKIRIRMRKGRA